MIETLSSPAVPTAVVAERTALQIPSNPEWIAPTVEYLKQKAVLCGACQESRATKLVVALHEALTNAIVHGNLELSSDLKERSDNAFVEALAARALDPEFSSRMVMVDVDYNGERCRWTIADEGPGFNVERALARAEQAEPDLLASGRGILLMRAFMDDVRYESNGRRVILTLKHAAGQENRRQPRVPVHRPVHVAPVHTDGTVDWDAAYEAVSQNLSEDGVAILQAHLANSPRVLIGLDWEGQVVYMPAEIRHCRTHEDDVVELGCRFTRAAAPADSLPVTAEAERAIHALVENLSAQSIPPDERRNHPRLPYTAHISVTLASGEAIGGFARDVSRGGLSFLATSPVPLQEVMLSLPQPDQSVVRIPARVVRCHRLMDGIYGVGVRFQSED
jgi:anti-sigma regulatory factor (Ser/Thr protein kinase)